MSLIRIIGPFPPPVHGFAVMTGCLADYLEAQTCVMRHDMSSNAKSMPLRHIEQAMRALVAGLSVLFGRRAKVALGCNGGMGLIYTGLVAVCARLRGAEMTLQHHSYGYIRKQSALVSAICVLGGKRMTHVFLSASMQKDFEQKYQSGQRATVVPNALFVPPFESHRQPVKGRITLGLISNLSPEKGLNDFLDVAKTLQQENLPVDVHLAGPIENPADLVRVERAEKEGMLLWHGPLYGPSKADFFAGLDLFLFPTRYQMEAQPTVIYEAFAAGVPVIAFDRGTISDQVKTCLAVVPQDVDFVSTVLKNCRAMLEMPMEARVALADMARRRLAEDAQIGSENLAKIFDLTLPVQEVEA